MNETIFLLTEEQWINAAGVMLVFLGIGMIVTELFIPALGLIGLTGGLAAVTGAVVLHHSGYLMEMRIGIEAIIGVVIAGLTLCALSGWLAWRAYRRKVSVGPESLIGETAEIVSWSGRKGRVRIQGEVWQASAAQDMMFSAGDVAIVRQIENLTLTVEKPA